MQLRALRQRRASVGGARWVVSIYLPVGKNVTATLLVVGRNGAKGKNALVAYRDRALPGQKGTPRSCCKVPSPQVVRPSLM